MDSLGSGVSPGPRSWLAATSVLFAGLLASFFCLVPQARAADSCPNAEHRALVGATHLADCRVYEMVSPVEKGGNGANFVAGGGFSSADGDRLMYATFAAFPGSSSNILGNSYVATRKWPEWTSVHGGVRVDPIGGLQGSGLRVYGVSDDRTKIVFSSTAMLTPDAWKFGGSGELPLYMHDATDGTYRLLTPPPMAGTAPCEQVLPADTVPYGTQFGWGDSDYSHLLLTTTAALTCDAVGVAGSKVYMWHDGELELQSVIGGTPSAGSAGGFVPDTAAAGNRLKDHALSADGAVTWFSSPTTTSGALYRREDSETVRVNQAESSVPPTGTQSAYYHGATPDGSKVLFITNQALVDADVGNSAGDLYMYTHSDDPENDDNLTLISADSNGDGGSDAQGVLGMDESGEKIYFVTANQIVDGAPTRSGGRYIYVWDDGEIDFLGATTVAESAPSAGVPPWNSTNGNGSTRDFRWGRVVSADGQALMMSSLTRLDTPALDDVGPRQVYLYDHRSPGQGFQCVSCPPGGPTAGSDARLRGAPLYQGVFTNERRNLSADGRRAFFQTNDALVPEDVNGTVDVYMWQDGEPSLVSSGRSIEESYFVDSSADGDSVFFMTWERLSAWDIDGVADVYAARVGDGLPEPEPVEPHCVADQCQGPVTGSPEVPFVGSVGFSGDGNLSPEVGQPRASVRVSRLKAVSGSTAVLSVRVPGAGRVTLTGRAIRRKARSVTKAGAYRLRVTLRPRLKNRLKRKGSLRVAVRVSYRARGGPVAKKRVRVTFKRPSARRASAMRGGR